SRTANLNGFSTKTLFCAPAIPTSRPGNNEEQSTTDALPPASFLQRLSSLAGLFPPVIANSFPWPAADIAIDAAIRKTAKSVQPDTVNGLQGSGPGRDSQVYLQRLKD